MQRRASHVITRFTLFAQLSQLALRDYITPSCLGKKKCAGCFCGAVAQRNAFYHGCSAPPVHLNAVSVVQEMWVSYFHLKGDTGVFQYCIM